MIYLVCFFSSSLFAFFASRSKKKSSFIVLSIISILITVTLAGLRGIEVGIDTSNYYDLERFWRGAVSSSSFRSYMDLFFQTGRGTQELLFGVLTGLIAELTGSYTVFLFFCHLIIVSCYYIGAFRLKNHANPVFSLLLFYLLYYNHSLNVFRQYVAMSIIFAVVADIEKKKYLRYLLFVGIAFFFHNTAIIALGPLFLHFALYPKNPLKKPSSQRKFLTMIGIVGGTFSFLPIVRLLISRGVLSSKYLYYIESEETSSYALVFLFLSVEVFGLLLFWHTVREKDKYSDFFLYGSILFITLFVLATTVKYGKRIAAYFSFLNIVSLGMLIKNQKKASDRILAGCLVIGVVMVYWIYVYAVRKASRTFPYVLGV